MKRNGDNKERRELEERLRTGAKRLEQIKIDKDVYKDSLDLVTWCLDDLEETGLPGPDECEEAYRETSWVLELMYSYIKEALSFAPNFVTPEGEAKLRAMLDKVGNMRIQIWGFQKVVRQEREVAQISTDRCPPQSVNGISSMLSPEAVQFCLTCKYRAKCEDDRKQEYVPVATG